MKKIVALFAGLMLSFSAMANEFNILDGINEWSAWTYDSPGDVFDGSSVKGGGHLEAFGEVYFAAAGTAYAFIVNSEWSDDAIRNFNKLLVLNAAVANGVNTQGMEYKVRIGENTQLEFVDAEGETKYFVVGNAFVVLTRDVEDL